jgi:hypothetical protein
MGVFVGSGNRSEAGIVVSTLYIISMTLSLAHAHWGFGHNRVIQKIFPEEEIEGKFHQNSD